MHSARAIATRCCWPPESWLGYLCGLLGNAHAREVLHRRRFGLLLAHAARAHRRQRAVLQDRQVREQVELLEHHADFGAAPRRRWLGWPVSSMPSTTMWPFCTVSRRLMQRISVDLPEPEGPQITMRSPARTSRSMSVSTWKLPYHLSTPLDADDGLGVGRELVGHACSPCEALNWLQRRQVGLQPLLVELVQLAVGGVLGHEVVRRSSAGRPGPGASRRPCTAAPARTCSRRCRPARAWRSARRPWSSSRSRRPGPTCSACMAEASSSKRRISVPSGATAVSATSCVLARATPTRRPLRSAGALMGAFFGRRARWSRPSRAWRTAPAWRARA